MFDEYAKHPEGGKSEALRRSMLALMSRYVITYGTRTRVSGVSDKPRKRPFTFVITAKTTAR